MERTDVLELMATLKLYGMRAAYDEVILKELKLPTVSTRPTASVVRTISE